MIRAARFTTSPRTEYSFLEPLVPTIPENTSPDEIPTLHQVPSISLRAFLMLNAVKMAREASSSWHMGVRPQRQISVEPLSSMTSLFTDP